MHRETCLTENRHFTDLCLNSSLGFLRIWHESGFLIFFIYRILKLRNFSDLQDFSQLSSRTVTEVLMLEMKMAPNAKTYLVSGYPRNMRDVVEYSEKVLTYCLFQFIMGNNICHIILGPRTI